MGQHPGLARAGAGQHQQRALGVLDRLALGRVEPGEQALDAVGAGLGRRPRGDAPASSGAAARTRSAGSPAEHSHAPGRPPPAGWPVDSPVRCERGAAIAASRPVRSAPARSSAQQRLLRPGFWEAPPSAAGDAADLFVGQFAGCFQLFGEGFGPAWLASKLGESVDLVELPLAVFLDQGDGRASGRRRSCRLRTRRRAVALLAVDLDLGDVDRSASPCACRFRLLLRTALTASAPSSCASLFDEASASSARCSWTGRTGRGVLDHRFDFGHRRLLRRRSCRRRRRRRRAPRASSRASRRAADEALVHGESFRVLGERTRPQQATDQPPAEERPVRGSDLAAPRPGRRRRRARRAAARARRSAPRAPLIASAIGSGRWIQSASGPSIRLPSTRTGWPGLPTTVAPGGTSSTTTVLAPILAPSPTAIGPSSLAPEPTVTLSPEGRVALAALEPGAAQGHPLVERHPVADLGRLADHHAGAVVDEELLADLRRRVDLDPGHGAGQVGDRPRQPAAPAPRPARGRRGGRAAPAPRPSW